MQALHPVAALVKQAAALYDKTERAFTARPEDRKTRL
jgi:hypothetical protein